MIRCNMESQKHISCSAGFLDTIFCISIRTCHTVSYYTCPLLHYWKCLITRCIKGIPNTPHQLYRICKPYVSAIHFAQFYMFCDCGDAIICQKIALLWSDSPYLQRWMNASVTSLHWNKCAHLLWRHFTEINAPISLTYRRAWSSWKSSNVY